MQADQLCETVQLIDFVGHQVTPFAPFPEPDRIVDKYRHSVSVRRSSSQDTITRRFERANIEGGLSCRREREFSRDLIPCMICSWQELVEYVNSPEVESSALKGAMAHLNLTMLHPFSDGNGRVARCLQSAVLADQGILAPVFSSIEEYTGRNQQEYYDVLAETGGGGWNPARDCTRWVRFCIIGHYRQAQTLLRRTQEFSRLYDELTEYLTMADLPERTALALLQAAVGGKVRNSSYRVSADISNNLASRDLKGLVDAGFLVAEGEKRGRHYFASPRILELRRKTRLPKPIDDPFEDTDMVGPMQKSLFDT